MPGYADAAPRARSRGMWETAGTCGSSLINKFYTFHVKSRLVFKGRRTGRGGDREWSVRRSPAGGSAFVPGHDISCGFQSMPFRGISSCHSANFQNAFQTVQNVNNDACVQRGTAVHNSFLPSRGVTKQKVTLIM
jgi:hypothetical protein